MSDHAPPRSTPSAPHLTSHSERRVRAAAATWLLTPHPLHWVALRSSHTSSCMGPPNAGALLPQGLCTCCSPCLDPLPPVALRLTLRLLLGLCPDVPALWALLTPPYETTCWAVASRLSLTRPWYESTLRFRAPISPLGHRLPILFAALALTCGVTGANQMPMDICGVWEPEGRYVLADKGLDNSPPA